MQQSILFIVWSYHVALMRCVSGKFDIYMGHVAQKNYESLAIMFSKWLCYQYSTTITVQTKNF